MNFQHLRIFSIHWLSLVKISACLALLSLPACSRKQEEGVQFILSTDSLQPTTTFELRFDEIVAAPNEIGLPAKHPPLLISPPLAGVFTWLSQRSGVFTPNKPILLGRKYSFTLRADLRKPDGKSLVARLSCIMETPPLSITDVCMRETASTNASAEPIFLLQFNAAVRAEDVWSYLEFRNGTGERVPAEARHAKANDYFYHHLEDRGGDRSTLTWREQFYAMANKHALSASPNESAVAPILNRLVITPKKPLTIGTGWKLVVAKGVPSTETDSRLPKALEIGIGNILPFKVAEVTAHNGLSNGKRVAIAFTKPISSDITRTNVSDWVSVAPEPKNLSATTTGNEIHLSGDFQLDQSYTVVVRRGLPSADPFTLATTSTNSFSFSALPPRIYFPAFSTDQLSGGQRQFQLLAVNVPRVKLRAKLLDRHTLIHVLRGYKSYFSSYDEDFDYTEPYREVDFNLVPGKTIFETTLDSSNATDVSRKMDLDWDAILGERKAGAVFLAAEQNSPDQRGRSKLGTQTLVQLTDLGLVWKRSGDEILVYVFSHKSGEPVRNATVQLLTDDNEALCEETSDEHGLAQMPLKWGNAARWLMAELGEDLHAIRLEAHGLPLYGFNIPSVESANENYRKVMLFSDRPVYRPGETMHLKAILRDWQDKNWTVPAATSATLRCFDPKEQKFFETNLTVSALGSLAQSVPLPQGALGHYRAELHFQNQNFYHGFQVQDYQPNAFEITLSAKKSYAPGEKINVLLSAKYFLGKTLSRAKARWTLDARDAGFAPEGFGDFSFGTAVWQSELNRQSSSLTLQGEGTFTDKTNFLIAPIITLNPKAPQPRQVDLWVEMTDVNQQTLSQSAEFICHSSDFYLGLKNFKDVVRAGERQPVELIAVRSNGAPFSDAVKAAVTVQRIEWHIVRVQGAGRAITYRSEPVFTNIVEQQVSTRPLVKAADKWETKPDGEPPFSFTPTEPGLYLIEGKTKDAAGRDVITALTFNVYGSNQIPWNYRNEAQIDLVHDQKSYTPGQTAVVLVKTPISGKALVTVEREEVLRSFIMELTGNAPSIRIPLEEGDAPNVFVSVLLLRGSDKSPKRFKAPEYRLGYCQINVEKPESKLAITIQSDAVDYRPGDSVHVTTEIKDAAGQPILDAEVTLYAVDEGVLSLTGYSTPDPHAFFYETRPLAVRCGLSLPNLLPEDPEQRGFSNKGYLIGGGGNGERLRKNFLACAFWNATLRTDSAGKIKTSFTAPDSLTRYRVIAVAHTAKSQFGSGQTSIQINKPIMIEPALPRFANVTDRIVARAVLLNQTAQAGEVAVSLQLDDKARTPSPSRKVALAARGSAIVEFPLEFVETGTAKWIWKAHFVESAAGSASPATFTDSVQTTLNVNYPAPLLREIYLTRTESAETNLLASANPQILEGKGDVSVKVSNTRLSELGEAISQLLHYPYGCVEQTSSSLLPWIVLRDARESLPQLCHAPADMDAAIRSGITRLLSMQTSSGGLSYWPGGKEPMLWGSAYGGLALALASRQHLPVPKANLDRLTAYLSEQLRSSGGLRDNGSLSERCLALYTLALAGRPEASYHEVIFKKRNSLSSESRALLALAILESKGSGEMVEELLSSKPSSKRSDNDWFGCDAREIAVRLLAWSAFRPAAPAVDVLVAELMQAQSKGHWNTTQGNAWSLFALTEYAARVETRFKNVEGSVTWGQNSGAFQLAEKTATFEKTFTTSPQLASTPLVLANPLKRLLFTQVKLEARPTALQQPRQDRGFMIQRTYARLDDDNQPQDLKQFRVGDRVLVTLQFEVRQPAHYLAIDDPLPAVFEAINPEFKSQQTALTQAATQDWVSDFRELRSDRALFFRNHLGPGHYTIRYIARVRAAGTATAPGAKIEEMYHPERFGFSETAQITSLPLE